MEKELDQEINRGEAMGIQGDKMEDLKEKALWEMSAINRNRPGTKAISEKFGLSKDEVKKLLLKLMEDARSKGNTRPLDPCYDCSTGKYLSFEEWLEDLIKRWDRLKS